MKSNNSIAQEKSLLSKNAKSEALQMVLFMLFFPGIYMVGKLVTQLF